MGQNPLVSHFLKGVFNCRPKAPRYATTWDVDVVFCLISRAFQTMTTCHLNADTQGSDAGGLNQCRQVLRHGSIGLVFSISPWR